MSTNSYPLPTFTLRDNLFHSKHRTEQNVCRVCRGAGTDTAPLFHPCLCSGSIKHIHEGCLVDWLKKTHAGPRSGDFDGVRCEVCKHEFKFRPVYNADMPNRLPVIVIAKGLVTKFANFILSISRLTLIIGLWLLVPLTAALVMRCYGLSINPFYSKHIDFFAESVPQNTFERSIAAHCGAIGLGLVTDILCGLLITAFHLILLVGGLFFRDSDAANVDRRPRSARPVAVQPPHSGAHAFLDPNSDALSEIALSQVSAATLPANSQAIIARQQKLRALALRRMSRIQERDEAASGTANPSDPSSESSDPEHHANIRQRPVTFASPAPQISRVQPARPPIQQEVAPAEEDTGFFTNLESITLDEFLGITGPLQNVFGHVTIATVFNLVALHILFIFPLFFGRAISDLYAPRKVDYLPIVTIPTRFLFKNAQQVAHQLYQVANNQVVFQSIINHAADCLKTIHHFANEKVAPFQPLVNYMFELEIDSNTSCLLIGYYQLLGGFWVLCTLITKMNMTSPILIEFRDSFRFIFRFFKLIAGLSVDLIVFPVVIGYMIEFCTAKLFGFTVEQRVEAALLKPLSSMFVHWAIGLVEALVFSYLLHIMRDILRPGVLHMIRNPSDPEYQPASEIVRRSLYQFVAGLVFASTAHLFIGLLFFYLPAKLLSSMGFVFNVDSSTTLLPADFLALENLIFPLLLRLVNPKKTIKLICMIYFHIMARILRLRLYLLGVRDPAEEKGRGKWTMMPNQDRIYSGKEIRVAQRITPRSEDIDRFFNSEARDEMFYRFSPIYVPNIFVPRLWIVGIGFVLWLNVSVYSLVVGPILLGRFVISKLMDRTIHDVYCLSVGGIICLTIQKIAQSVYERCGNGAPSRIRLSSSAGLVDERGRLWTKGLQMVFVLFLMTIVWPLMFGILAEKIVLGMLHTNRTFVTYPFTCFFYGFMVWRSSVSLIDLVFPSLRIGHVLRSIQDMNLVGFNFSEIVRDLIMPMTATLLALIAVPPFAVSIVAAPFIGNRELFVLIRSSHLIATVGLAGALVIRALLHRALKMIDGVRNDMYLVGQRLLNLEPEKNKQDCSLEPRGLSMRLDSLD